MVDLLRPITEKELYKRNELKRYIATVHYIDVTEKDDNTTSDKTSVEIIQDKPSRVKRKLPPASAFRQR